MEIPKREAPRGGEAHDMLETRWAQVKRTTVFCATLSLLAACSTCQLPIEGQRDASYRHHPGGALLAYLGWVQEGYSKTEFAARAIFTRQGRFQNYPFNSVFAGGFYAREF